MLSRERVIEVIEHRTPDRVPVYGWVTANLTPQITEKWGSVAAFEDKYEFDFTHLFGGPARFTGEQLQELGQSLGRAIEPKDLLAIEDQDVNNMAAYDDLRAQVEHHKIQRGRFAYVQTPGIFEALNGVFGIENHLTWLALYPEDLKEVYRRQAEWNLAFGRNCLEIGCDMVHVSDDWGAQAGLMFSPKTWWELMYPYHKIICDGIKQSGGYLSLHSDGNVNQVIDGIIDLGYNVVHPWQESAGMSITEHQEKYRDKFTVMGGLDVQTTIGFGKIDFLREEILRVLELGKTGGLLYCTTHFIQDHCTMEELEFAYDLIFETVRRHSRP